MWPRTPSPSVPPPHRQPPRSDTSLLVCACRWRGLLLPTGWMRASKGKHGHTKWRPSSFLSKKGSRRSLCGWTLCTPRPPAARFLGSLLCPKSGHQDALPSSPRGPIPHPAPPPFPSSKLVFRPLPQGPNLSILLAFSKPSLFLNVHLSPLKTLHPSQVLSHMPRKICPILPANLLETSTSFLVYLSRQQECDPVRLGAEGLWAMEMVAWGWVLLTDSQGSRAGGWVGPAAGAGVSLWEWLEPRLGLREAPPGRAMSGLGK